jgi:hypothetical protein
MTDDRSLERAARSWLEEGPTQAPDSAVNAALSRIQTTRQDWDLRILWRLPTMSVSARVLAAGVVLAAVGLGAILAVLRPTAGPGTGASGPPTAVPTSPPSSLAASLTARLESTRHAVTIAYPSGWTATPASLSYPKIDDAVGDFDAYDRVEGDGSRFIVTSGALQEGQSFDEYRASGEARIPSRCRITVEQAEPMPVGSAVGYLTARACSALGSYGTWWRAVAYVGGVVYVFQLDTNDPSQVSVVFQALLASVTFEERPQAT